MIKFELLNNDNLARRGRIYTSHGIINTPVFMPVGTAGSIKSLTNDQIISTNSEIILSNTYHLYLRPGMKVIEKFGGIHNFMNWNKPILTDSGGFQVMSLSRGLVKVSEEGVEFKSHIDGGKHFFTPEKSIQIQKLIGADIIMAFDDVVPDEADFTVSKNAMERTLRWLDRCVIEWGEGTNKNQSLFGIIQGGVFKDLRIESTKRTLDKNLPGIAIGGGVIGYNKERTKEVLERILPLIPQNIPRYTMGVGDIDDIFEVAERGIDMFDCVSPTRLARNAALLISPSEGGNKENKFRLNISRSIYSLDENPIDKTCSCYTCQNYSRGYINHLFRSHELLCNTLSSIHNIYMLSGITRSIREAIEENKFNELKKKWID